MKMKQAGIPFFSIEHLFLQIADVLCGYGEKPFRIIKFSIQYVLAFALIFSFAGITHSSGFFKFSLSQSLYTNLNVFYNALYYSIVTFTTLGYCDFTTVTIGKFIATIEAFTGVFIAPLFVITVYKRTMER